MRMSSHQVLRTVIAVIERLQPGFYISPYLSSIPSSCQARFLPGLVSKMVLISKMGLVRHGYTDVPGLELCLRAVVGQFVPLSSSNTRYAKSLCGLDRFDSRPSDCHPLHPRCSFYLLENFGQHEPATNVPNVDEPHLSERSLEKQSCSAS